MTSAQPKRRRVRMTRGSGKRLHAKSKELEGLIDLAARKHRAAELASLAAADALAQIQEIMKVNGQSKVMTDRFVAEMIVPRSNSQTIIDPVLFRNAVQNDEEFYGAIKVGITDAKKVLPEKTIEKISEKIPAKKKDPVAKVRERTDKD